MSLSPDELSRLKTELSRALNHLTKASANDNTKGRFIKAWFDSNFSAPGRASLINEAKQASNRPKEQLSDRDAEHVIFVLADAKAHQPVVRNFLKLTYPGLKTVLLVMYSGGKFKPLEFYESEASGVGEFYRAAFSLEPHPFIPHIVDTPFNSQSAPPPRSSETEDPVILADDLVLKDVRQLLSDGFGGVIFSGPPGTSKSWYARQVALSLVDGDKARLRFVQFHPGYQYEDFVEGYVPNDHGGFDPVPRSFLEMCSLADDHHGQPVVIVIDELSRTDVVRVFGEALTYLEISKRDLPFILASGKQVSVPGNLIIIATMNPWDRGVDELDLALERRFAKIRFEPKVDALRSMLQPSHLSEIVRQKVEQFFFKVSRHENPLCRIGHAYFRGITSLDSLKRRWENQLSFHFERVLRDSPDELREVQSAWDRIFAE